jgi:hypothetical protein
MTTNVPSELEELRSRLDRLEEEAAITKVILSYGIAADAGMASFAGALWLEEGTYDWDARGAPHVGSEGVEAMLASDAHQSLIAQGVAHVGGPPLLDVEGERARAVNYSLIIRREEGRSYLWRVSAVRWDLERTQGTWRVRRRTNRLLDATAAGSELLASTLQEMMRET